MLTGIPATSLWALRAKAEEHHKVQGLFKDALAADWYQQARWLYTPEIDKHYSPVLQRAIALRTQLLDQTVRAHFERFPQGRLLELGCGFSTRFSRLQLAQGEWYELDLPEMIEWRASFGFPQAAHHWHLATSVMDPDWLDWLPADRPTELLILAEGLLMYFPRAEVETLLQRLQARFPGARLIFDVIGKWNLKAAQAAAQELNSPIFWGATHIQKIAQELGLQPEGILELETVLRQLQSPQCYISPLAYLLLRWKWLSYRLGGTVLAKL